MGGEKRGAGNHALTKNFVESAVNLVTFGRAGIQRQMSRMIRTLSKPHNGPTMNHLEFDRFSLHNNTRNQAKANNKNDRECRRRPLDERKQNNILIDVLTVNTLECLL